MIAKCLQKGNRFNKSYLFLDIIDAALRHGGNSDCIFPEDEDAALRYTVLQLVVLSTQEFCCTVQANDAALR